MNIYEVYSEWNSAEHVSIIRNIRKVADALIYYSLIALISYTQIHQIVWKLILMSVLLK